MRCPRKKLKIRILESKLASDAEKIFLKNNSIKKFKNLAYKLYTRCIVGRNSLDLYLKDKL